MQSLSFVIAFASLFAVRAAPFAQTPPPQEKPAEKAKPVDIYDEKADATAQIDAALARAKKENRRVLVQWGGNWCHWCVKLHALFKSDAAIAKQLDYEYDVVLVDIGQGDKHMDVVQKYGANLDAGVPYLTVLDADGKALANQETGALEIGDKHDPKKVLEFLKQHQAKPLVAEEVRTAAFARAKAENKRVFMHFGAPWCGWCHKLEGWMAQPEVAELLAKDFVDLKIDTDRMLGGKEALATARGSDKGGIPWFLFLDADGKVLADSNDAAGNNTGFPYADEEIAHFVTMLGKARVNLTPADIETLRKSLVASREADEARKRAAGAK